ASGLVARIAAATTARRARRLGHRLAGLRQHAPYPAEGSDVLAVGVSRLPVADVAIQRVPVVGELAAAVAALDHLELRLRDSLGDGRLLRSGRRRPEAGALPAAAALVLLVVPEGIVSPALLSHQDLAEAGAPELERRRFRLGGRGRGRGGGHCGAGDDGDEQGGEGDAKCASHVRLYARGRRGVRT